MDKQDILNRQPFINNVLELLNRLSMDKTGCAFAIDGTWGIGKTFVLEEIEKQIEDVQTEETSDNRFYLFHYNCWQYDYYPEPAVAIISAMLDKANDMTSAKVGQKVNSSWKIVMGVLKGVAGNFVKNNIGIDVIGIADKVMTEEKKRGKDEIEFDKLFSFKKTIEKTRDDIKKIADKKTVLIVVDELDRCLPEYAIKVLERLHHIFDGLDNVIVIFAIDSKQLEHSVKMIYGRYTDVDRYLNKFISFKLHLNNGEAQEALFEEYNEYFSLFENKYFKDEYDVRNIVINIFDKTKLDIRQRKKAFELIQNIHKMVSTEKQDYSVMLFEILTIFFSFTKRENDRKRISDLAEITLPRSERLKDEIGYEFYNFIRETEKNCYMHALHVVGNADYYICTSSVSVMFFVLKEVSLVKNTFGDKDPNKYKEELQICKVFDDYRKMLV